MNRCPITYEDLGPGSSISYSKRGLRLLSPRLTDLKQLPYSAAELKQEALARATKLSIQGVQPKLSARLNYLHETFEFVDINGTFILKPPHETYEHLPENEDLTMRLAGKVGIEVPVHGLVYNKDNTLTYFIRRFDRYAKNKKRPAEDFAQLSGRTRETKYDSSMEQVIKVIAEHCTFPLRENEKLLRLSLFSFLTGNEDMHLKNFSLLAKDGIVALSPAYDLLNTTLVLPNPSDEFALPLNGKKNNHTKNDFINYFAKEQLQLTDRVIEKVLQEILGAESDWSALISKSFLPKGKQEDYLSIIERRRKRLR